jgi:hypothetical protein
MGARIKISEVVPNWRDPVGINIREDKNGEFFDIKINANEPVDYEVVDLRSDLRHLLLIERSSNGSKNKFLCGHDERHWFVCAVPGRSVSNVVKAMESLQPADVRLEVMRKIKRAKNRLTRRNEAFVRQGEWFFVPVELPPFNENLILKNEPISRGNGSKPHFCEEVYRDGGSERINARAIQPIAEKKPESAEMGLASDARKRCCLRARKGAPSRPQNDCFARLASRFNEHGK